MKHLLIVALLTGCSRDEQGTDTGDNGSSEISEKSWSYNLISKSLDFGELDLDASATQVIILQNNGESSLYLLELSALEAKGLSVAMPSSPALQRGDVANIVVTWDPVEVGQMSGNVTLKLGASATDFEELVVPVTGNASGATLVISTKEFDFGDVNVGCDDELTVTITNTGNSTVTVDEVRIEGDSAFSVDLGEHSIPMDLAPFQSLVVDVDYSPVGN